MCQGEEVVDKRQAFESLKQSSLEHETESSPLHPSTCHAPEVWRVAPGSVGPPFFILKLSEPAQSVITGKAEPRDLWLPAASSPWGAGL